MLLSLAMAAAHDQCAAWAERGECASNPNFMLEKCASACCATWAERGECSTIPEAMVSPCADACTESVELLATHCATWASSGECERNGNFMLQHCSAECAAAEARTACSVRACDGLSPVCEQHDALFNPAAGAWEMVNVTFRARQRH
jgi:hypothetical protein